MKTQKKRIIIHTGPGKTGSSAIQAWLTKNTKWLQSQGVFYPKHNLSKEQISSGNLREILVQKKDDTSWQVDLDKVSELMTRFKNSRCNILLLSSEFFFHNIIKIQDAIPEAEFVAYIRNPVELLESNYNQSVKRHSSTKLFTAPSGINHFLWQYLTRVYNKIDNSHLHLRPFDESLMQGGNIISDLLSILDIELTEILDNKRINPSFTFPCMEFKRLLNHFGLGPLEQHIDKILQRCDIGIREYSLISPEKFEQLNSESCTKMEKFISKFSLQDLTPLLEAFKRIQQRPYIEQRASLSELTEVLEYIKESDIDIYNELHELVARHPNLVVDNELIFKLFSVEIKPLVKGELIGDMLLQHINQFTVHPNKRGRICYELAGFYLLQNDTNNAFMYAKAAYYFSPTHQAFIERLNEIIRLINNMQDERKSDIKSVFGKTSAIGKFKKLLKR